MTPEKPMGQVETRYTFDRTVRLLLSVATVIGTVMLLRYLSDVLLPFVAAVVLAYLLNPMVTLFEKKTKRRGLAVAMTLGGVGIVGTTTIAILIPLMAYQVGEFRHALEKLQADLAQSAQPAMEQPDQANETQATGKPQDDSAKKSTFGWVELKNAWGQYRRDSATEARAVRLSKLRQQLSGTYVGDLLDRTITYTRSDEFNRWLLDLAKQVALGGWSVLTFALNFFLGLTGMIVILLYLVFLLLDFPEYARRWPTFLPPQYRDAIVDFYAQFSVVMRSYFRGQAVVALLVGALFAIGFTLIGLPMAVPFGLFVGMLNMVPYLQMVGLVPGFLLAGLRTIEGDSSFLVSIGLVLLVFAVVQLIQDALITPRIMGRATGLRPVAILLGIFIWGKLLGFMGLLLAIPLTCVGIAYYQRYVLQSEQSATTKPIGEQ